MAATISCLLLAGPARAEDGGAPASPDVVRLLGEVRESEIRKHLDRLTGVVDAPLRAGARRIRSRSDYHPDVQVAEGYLAETLAAQGLEARRVPFAFDGPIVLANVEGTLRGAVAPSEIYVLGAHYDSTAKSDAAWVRESDPAPGADDNASGCALVLEAARVLAAGRLRATVRYLFFAAEEEGLVGSAAYARAARARGEDLRLVLSMDPVGNTGPLAGNLFFTYDAASLEEAYAMQAVGERYRLAYPVLVVPGDSPTLPDDRSDHASFWAEGYRGLHGGSLPGDDYHTARDTADKVDVRFVAEATRAVVARLAEVAGHEPRRASGGGGCAHAAGAGWLGTVVVLACVWLGTRPLPSPTSRGGARSLERGPRRRIARARARGSSPRGPARRWPCRSRGSRSRRRR
jgi:hypothetical protein